MVGVESGLGVWTESSLDVTFCLRVRDRRPLAAPERQNSPRVPEATRRPRLPRGPSSVLHDPRRCLGLYDFSLKHKEFKDP